MKVYIAGPMTGIPEHNYPAFFRAERVLKSCGYDTLNPAKKHYKYKNRAPSQKEMKSIIKMDMLAVMQCDAIYMLYGWESSKGARAEHALAVWLGLRIWYQPTVVDMMEVSNPIQCSTNDHNLEEKKGDE